MSIEYLGLNEINGPLVVLEGVQNASFEEIVEIVVDNNEKKLGRIESSTKTKPLSRYLREMKVCPLKIPTQS